MKYGKKEAKREYYLMQWRKPSGELREVKVEGFPDEVKANIRLFKSMYRDCEYIGCSKID